MVTDPRVLAQAMQTLRGSLFPFTAWVEDATAALLLCQEQTVMVGRLPKSILELSG